MRLALPMLLLALAPPLAAQPPADTAPPAAVLLGGARAGVARPPLALAPAIIAAPSLRAAGDTGRRAVDHSDWYYRRLTVHRYTSYAMVPLFAAQYVLGDRLLDERADGGEASSTTRNLHGVAAGGIAGLFAVNTVTGAWNWWEDRREAEGRTKRTVHSLLMLAAGAGFVATGVTANSIEDDGEGEAEDGGGEGDPDLHRSIAIGSMALATAGAALMWFWKD